MDLRSLNTQKFRLWSVIIMIFVGMFVAIWVEQEYRAEAEARTQKAIDKAISESNITPNPRYTARCVNDWLVIDIGVHKALYARDKDFKPIPCQLK